MQLALTDKQRIVRLLLTFTPPEPPPICPVCNKPECHASHERHTEDKPLITQTEDETRLRDDVDFKNRRDLVNLMLEHNITIPTREFDKWRPTERTTGHIEGVSDGLECIMTNGLLGYFLRGDRAPLYGHMAHFIWDSAKVTMIPYEDAETGEKKYFKSTQKRGVPPTLHKATHDKPTKVRKSKKPTSADFLPQARDAIAQGQSLQDFLAQYPNGRKAYKAAQIETI